jgi:hypothetical protein
MIQPLPRPINHEAGTGDMKGKDHSNKNELLNDCN